MPESLPPPHQLFTVSMDYSATGEGVTVALLVIETHDAAAAKTAFLDAHGYHGSSREYFGRGVQVTPGIDRALLSRWIAPRLIDALEHHHVPHARLMMRWSFNAS